MRQFRFSMKWVSLLLTLAVALGAGWMPSTPAQAQGASLSVTAVLPNRAANDVDTPIEISGSGFSNTEGLPQVYLGDQSIAQVEWVSESALTAVVPWGLQAGVYALRVVNPDGSEASLDPAFEVTQGVGQWNASAMDGGPVRDLLPITNTPGLLYAHSEVTSGVYKSTDYGAHWATVGHVYGQYFGYDPVDPSVLYLNASRSMDGGVTWRNLLPDNYWPGTQLFPGQYAQTFLYPTDTNVLFVAAAAIPTNSSDPAGLLRSNNFGETWTTVEAGLLDGDTSVTALAFAGSTVYLGTRAGNLYTSTDLGDHWQRVGTTNVLPSVGVMKINPYDANEMWITTHYAMTAEAKIVKMNLTTQEVTQVTGWGVENYPRTMGFLGANTVFIGALWDNGWVTEDDGATWVNFKPSTGKPGNSLVQDPWETDPNSYTFYMADEQYGVQKTTIASPYAWSNATWTPINQGLHAMSPNYLKIDPANPARVYAKIAENGWPGIFVSENGGQSWDFSSLEPATDPVRPMTSMLAVNGDRLFAGAHGNDVLGYGPQVYISDDQGVSWTRSSLEAIPDYADSFHMPWVLEADPHNPQTLLLVAVAGNRSMTSDQFVSEIYRSTTNGNSWTRLRLAQQLGRQVNNLSFLAFDPNDSNVVYASGDHDILKSTDNGATWSVILSDNNANLRRPIAVEPVPPYRVYVGSLVSADGGASWAPVDMPLEPQQIAFVPGTDTVYIAGDGLAYSLDGGATWQRVDGPLGTTGINALAVTRVDERTVVYVGTPGGDAPQPQLSAAGLNTTAPTALEAGVYRMTEIRHNLFLPLMGR